MLQKLILIYLITLSLIPVFRIPMPVSLLYREDCFCFILLWRSFNSSLFIRSLKFRFIFIQISSLWEDWNCHLPHNLNRFAIQENYRQLWVNHGGNKTFSKRCTENIRDRTYAFIAEKGLTKYKNRLLHSIYQELLWMSDRTTKIKEYHQPVSQCFYLLQLMDPFFLSVPSE